jgi:hypothetical protein
MATLGIGEIALPLLIAGTAASAAGSIMSGNEKATAAEFESQQYAQQAQAAQTASLQDDTARRRDLTSNLETIQAIRAGRGVGASSPTAMAIYNNTIGMSEDDIAASKANYSAKADLAERASILSQRRHRHHCWPGPWVPSARSAAPPSAWPPRRLAKVRHPAERALA